MPLKNILLFAVITIVSLGCAQSAPILSTNELVEREQLQRKLLARGVWLLRQDSEQTLILAKSVFLLALKLDPQDVRVIDGLGCIAFRQKDYQLARSFFSEAILRNPKYDRPYAHLALTEANTGNIPLSLKLFEQAIDINPLNYQARNNYALLLQSQGPIFSEQAISELQKAMIASEGVEERIGLNLELITKKVNANSLGVGVASHE